MTLASLDTKNERNLDVGQGHVVFDEVNNKLVRESKGNVESIHVVVQVVLTKSSTEIFVRTHDRVVSSIVHGSLKKKKGHQPYPFPW